MRSDGSDGSGVLPLVVMGRGTFWYVFQSINPPPEWSQDDPR